MASVPDQSNLPTTALPSERAAGNNRVAPLSQPTDKEKASFLHYLEQQIRNEQKAVSSRINRIWRMPIPERVAQGYAIEGLSILKETPTGELILRCDTNRSRFREGDSLCLSQGNPMLGPAMDVTLETDDEGQLTVAPLPFAVPLSSISGEADGWVLDQGYQDLSHFYIDAIRDLGDSTIGRERILPFLMGAIQPSIDGTRLERGLAIGEVADLNWSQTEALAHAYATDSVYLIQGPPGTGKTRVLAHLAEALVDEGERVLITAFTHRAINNALNTLGKHAPLTAAAKIGEPKRADDLQIENYASFDGSRFADLSQGYAIGATPFATRTQRLRGVEFDTVIFDEASQITIPLAIMGMLPARKWIFIGDHWQLPPVLQSIPANEAPGHSIFGRLVDRGFDTLLDETYRLNTCLAEWPSRQFYDDRLQPIDSVAERTVKFLRSPRRWESVLDPQRCKVFVDVGHKNARTRSRAEANLVVDLIAEILNCGASAAEIGVVTPYRAQSREIRSLLRLDQRTNTVAKEIVVDTVERMQGQERDIIIVSLTTSESAFALRLAEFFYQPQRVNVAITRPRSKLIVVGSSRLFEIQPDESELEASVALLEDLIKACDYVVPDSKAEF